MSNTTTDAIIDPSLGLNTDHRIDERIDFNVDQSIHLKNNTSKTIAVLLTHDFTDLHYSEPVQAYRAAGHRVLNVEHAEGNIVHGRHNRTSVSIDLSIDDSCIEHFDALLIPGGVSPTVLRTQEVFVSFVRDFADTGKPIFSLSYGSQLLLVAGVVKGRQLTCTPSLHLELQHAGATIVNEAVINDSNQYITARRSHDLPDFIAETLKVLANSPQD